MNPQVLLLSIQLEHITRLNIATGPGSTQRETLVPAGKPVNTRRPDGMSYGPRSTPDTPFTDHSGEPLPAWPLHLPPHCKYIVNACQLPPAKRLDNKRFVKWVYWFIYTFRASYTSTWRLPCKIAGMFNNFSSLLEGLFILIHCLCFSLSRVFIWYSSVIFYNEFKEVEAQNMLSKTSATLRVNLSTPTRASHVKWQYIPNVLL